MAPLMKNTEEEMTTQPASPYLAGWVQVYDGGDAVMTDDTPGEVAEKENTQKDLDEAEDSEEKKDDEVEEEMEKGMAEVEVKVEETPNSMVDKDLTLGLAAPWPGADNGEPPMGPGVTRNIQERAGPQGAALRTLHAINREKSLDRVKGTTLYTFTEHIEGDLETAQLTSGIRKLAGVTLVSFAGTRDGTLEVVVEINNKDSGELAKHFIRDKMIKLKAMAATEDDTNTKVRGTSRTAHFGEHFQKGEKGEKERGRSPPKNTAPKNTAAGSSSNDGPTSGHPVPE